MSAPSPLKDLIGALKGYLVTRVSLVPERYNQCLSDQNIAVSAKPSFVLKAQWSWLSFGLWTWVLKSRQAQAFLNLISRKRPRLRLCFFS